MAARPPSAPPALPGFDHVKLLGRGGFADVFLYQQLHPRRQVAVKVLLKDRLGTTTAEGFAEEANLMAQLATHPSIVSVYQAGVADDGRPYLVMEYCSRPNLQVRHRRERFSEAEALRVGVQIAGAVETAHRAGILHRDIKPANILVTDYGRPALTDFGISATTSDALTGMSIPWSPPESLTVPPQGFPSSDVYSLAATLFTLLTNRTPFEIPGASNTELDVMARIQSMPLPSTGRPDVSNALQAVLARAMDKDPFRRYASAAEFARALQRVQIELGMQATQLDVLEEELLEDETDEGEERTRFRGVTSIDAQSVTSASPQTLPSPAAVIPPAPPAPAPVWTNASTLPPAPARVAPAPVAPELDATLVRELSAVPVSPADSPPPRRRRGVWIASAAALLLVVGGVGVAMALASPGAATPAESEAAPASPVDAVGEDTPPAVADLAGTATADGVSFTWRNPEPVAGDVYLWRPVVPGQSFTFEETDQLGVTLAADPSGRTCVEVVLRRADGTSAAQSAEGCAP